MKNLKLLIPAIALAAVSSISLAAQQPPDSPAPDTQSPSQTAPDTPSPSQPDAPQQTAPVPQDTAPADTAPAEAVPPRAEATQINNADLRPVSGELENKIDSKNAKAGDAVVVKTTENATFADGIAIPKGSKITGHVTEVLAHDKSNENSKVTLQFDQAELKGGQTMPIRSVLQSISAAAGSDAAPGSPYGSGAASNSMPSGGSAGAPRGSTSSGGAPSGSVGGNMGNDKAPMQGTAQAANPGTDSTPNALPPAGAVVAHQGNVDIRTTGIPGVFIAAQSNGQPFSNAAGALLGAKQNVHLDGGTKVTLAVADANNKASNAP